MVRAIQVFTTTGGTTGAVEAAVKTAGGTASELRTSGFVMKPAQQNYNSSITKKNDQTV